MMDQSFLTRESILMDWNTWTLDAGEFLKVGGNQSLKTQPLNPVF